MPYRVRVATRVTKRGVSRPRLTSVKYRTLRSAKHDASIIANTYDVVKTDKKGRILTHYV